MLSNYIDNLCKFITSNFEYQYHQKNTKNSLFINFDIYQNMITRSNFYSIWQKKFHHTYTDIEFKCKYTILEQYDDLLKIKLTIMKSFFINFQDKSIKSASIDEYLTIVECTNGNLFNTIILIPREENELYYNKYLITNLPSILGSNFNKFTSANTLLWKENIKNIDELYNKLINKFSPNRLSYSKFNINNAIKYAEKYALTPNNEYKNFNDSGGDCTNFISQILHAGGISFTPKWKPYTVSWLRVDQLYNYLIRNNIGKKLSNDAPYSKGSVIQFYTPQKGRYFHSGFITYVLPFNEALYCCHSYNKLNYPLSEIYPVIYPVIRCIALN